MSRSPRKGKTPISPSEAFSMRFESILFSLYDSSVLPKFDQIPVTPSESKPSREDPPSFESPICSFKARSLIYELVDDERNFERQFDERSRILLSELTEPEYDVKVSVVPYDMERTTRSVKSRRSSYAGDFMQRK